jgi:hypothetical protein
LVRPLFWPLLAWPFTAAPPGILSETFRPLAVAFRCRIVRDDLGDEPRTLSDHCFNCEKRLTTSVDSPGDSPPLTKLMLTNLKTG